MSTPEDQIAAVRVLVRLERLLESAHAGLTVPQYRVMAWISAGGVRSAVLAEWLSVRRPTLTAIVDGLVSAGYARRETEPGDRRVVNVFATDAGRAVLASADAVFRERFAQLLDDVPYGDRIVADLIAIGHGLDARMQSRFGAKTTES